MQKKIYWLGFSLFPGVGPLRFQKLLKQFGTAKAAWSASPQDLGKALSEKLTEHFLLFREQFSPSAYEEKLAKAEVSYQILSDDDYPALLKQIKDPPFVLFVKGNKKILNTSSSEDRQVQNDPPSFATSEGQSNYVAIVGTRKVTAYGRQVTEILTQDIVNARCIVVSGLALGVDAIAHQTTLTHKGKTIAVLGCGIDCPYPRENARIYAEIINSGGAIVSEYGLGVAPSKGTFPSRNRIIAGLSRAVLVTEGAASSGSLITANLAFANGRKVFAVPGPINSSLSQGPYALIKKGATLVTNAEEILDGIGARWDKRDRGDRKKITGDTREEQLLIDLLAGQEVSFDELVKKTEFSSQQLGMLLSLMEMKEMVVRLENGFFRLG